MWQPRWALIGDSIQAWVVEAGSTVYGRAKDLTATKVPQQVNASIQNISMPGMRLAKGQGTSDYVFDPAFLKKLAGPFGLNGVICTLGTNDYSDANVTTVDYFYAIGALAEAVKALNVPLVLVSPIWRADQANLVHKYDGSNQGLVDFQNTVQWISGQFDASYKVTFIDGKTAPVQNASFFGGDGLHLNAVGHDAFCTWLVNQMKAKGLWAGY